MVVLPAPLGPMSPASSPSWRAKVMSRTACTPPKVLPTPFSSSTVDMGSPALLDGFLLATPAEQVGEEGAVQFVLSHEALGTDHHDEHQHEP